MDNNETRPEEPKGDALAWYIGWEIGFNYDAHAYAGEGWLAYKGGADLDAPTVSGKTFDDVLREIEEAEDDNA